MKVTLTKILIRLMVMMTLKIMIGACKKNVQPDKVSIFSFVYAMKKKLTMKPIKNQNNANRKLVMKVRSGMKKAVHASKYSAKYRA